jgi:hypothetical protein
MGLPASASWIIRGFLTSAQAWVAVHVMAVELPLVSVRSPSTVAHQRASARTDHGGAWPRELRKRLRQAAQQRAPALRFRPIPRGVSGCPSRDSAEALLQTDDASLAGPASAA